MNDNLIKQLKSQLSFLWAEWNEGMDVLDELESLKVRIEDIKDEIYELELLIKEEEKKA